MNINLKQLSVFIAIAHNNSITLAAETLFMTKGAVSQTLAELENQLGVRLFDRQHARIRINNEGRKLLPIANELLVRTHNVESIFEKNHKDTQLRLGCTKTIGSYLLPDMLKDFYNNNGWMPQPIIANTEAISDMLENFEIDVALIEGITTEPNLISKQWLDDEMVIIAEKNHKLAKEKIISYSKLSLEYWLLREKGSSSRAFFDNQLALYLDSPKVALSLNTFDTILFCVANNLGVTFISKRVLKNPFYLDHFVKLQTKDKFFREFKLCYHKNKYISPTLQNWLDFCHSWSQNGLAEIN